MPVPGRIPAVVAFLACLTLLAACGGGSSSRTRDADAVTVHNCGVTVTFDRPPERVFTYYQHPTELLLALGLGDSIVGTAYPDNDPLPKYRDDYAALPMVSERTRRSNRC